jgi:hypothetical protein
MPTSDDSAQPSFEASLAELESIVHDLEEEAELVAEQDALVPGTTATVALRLE